MGKVTTKRLPQHTIVLLGVPGMSSTKKPLVCILIFLLTATALVGVFSPVKAETETWTAISSLPYTITEAGNYRITSPCNISGIGLSINASDVVVDGQNNLIQLTQAQDEYAILIAPGCRNVLLENINQTRSDFGIFAEEASFTVQNSFFTNNTSAGILAFNSTGIIVQHSMLSNNSYGLVTAYSEGGMVDDCHVKNCSTGIEILFTNNFAVQNTYMNNNTAAMDAFLSQNLTITGVLVNENRGGILMDSCSLAVDNSTLTNNEFGIQCDNCSLTTTNSELCNGTVGLYFLRGDYNVSNALLTNQTVGVLLGMSNATFQDCAVNNNQLYGLYTIISNVTIYSCVINNNTIGLLSEACPNLTLACSSVSNNTYLGLNDLGGGNTQVDSTIFSTNGLINASTAGAVMVEDSNCTVTNNLFERNYDALMLGIYYEEFNNTQLYQKNSFVNNSFTFNFNYQLPSNYTNQQIYFYNNLVNDTAYINPDSFNRGYFPPNTVLHLNGTLQAGERVYSDGRMIGGNFWAFPNGTGPSQTATDANHDGFADEPFDVFGNQTIYDFLPYTTGYTSTLTLTSGESQSLVANQTSCAVTVQYSDAFGKITSGLTVTLSSNSTTTVFFSDAQGTTPITTITIPNVQSTATFYFKDTTAGNPAISASAPSVNPDSETQIIAAHSDTVDHIVIVPDSPVIKAAQTINFTTTAYDQYGNSWNVTAEYTVNDNPPFEGDSLTANVPGMYLITSTYQGNQAQTVLTVTHGDLDRFIVLTLSSSSVGSAFLIRVVAVDSVGNIVTSFTGTVALTADGTSVSPSTSGNFENGEWYSSVTISNSGTFNITASNDEKTGTSQPVTITSGSTTTPIPTPTPTVTPTPDTVVATNGTTTVNVQLTGGNITSQQITNMQVSTNQTQNNTTTTISFTVSGPTGTTGFSNMTLSKSQIPDGTTPKVYIDGELAANQGYTEDNQNYYVWYTTSFSTHNVKIEFTGQPAAPEEQPILLYAAIITVVALLAVAVLVLSRRRQK